MQCRGSWRSEIWRRRRPKALSQHGGYGELGHAAHHDIPVGIVLAILGAFIAACLLFSTWATVTSGKDPAWDLGTFNFKLHPVMIGVVAHLVLLVVGFVASFLFPRPEPGNRDLTLWGWLESRKSSLSKELTEMNRLKGLGGGALRSPGVSEPGRLEGGVE